MVLILVQLYIYYNETYVIQIKICAEYRDMLPRPRLVCQEPGLRPIGRSPGVPDKSSRGLGSMSRYSAQILICFIAYIFLSFFSLICGFGLELCRTASMHSALCHCPLQSEWGWSSDNQSSQHALLRCSWPIKTLWHLHGGQPVGATISCAHFQNGVDSRALYPGASSEGSRQCSNTNKHRIYWDV